MNNILLIAALISFLIAIPPLPLRFNAVALGLFLLTLIKVLGHDISL